MITFNEFLKKMGEEIVGLYPPQYGGMGNYPPATRTGSDQVYIKASLDLDKARKKKKRRKKKK